MSLLSRLKNVFRTDDLDSELADEMEFHIEMRTRELIGRGIEPEEASRQAQLRFENALRYRESCRDIRLLAWFDSIVGDIRIGLRTTLKTPLTASAVIVSLALAIGANMSAFALLDAVMFRPLRVCDPRGLFYLTFPPVRNTGLRTRLMPFPTRCTAS